MSNQQASPTKQEYVDIYIMGKKYRVPSSLTIMKAIEYAGYKLLRGCGCRAGFCGACSTVFRLGGDHQLRVGLACQTKVEQDISLAQIPFYPAHQVHYDLNKLKATGDQVVELYPEITKCLGCNACTSVCPQDIKVMKYISLALRGEISKAADESFDCLLCGLCSTKCPANIVQYKVGLLCRRLHGKYLAPQSAHVQTRIDEIEGGIYEEKLAQLMNLSKEELAQLYNSRDIEE
jgi:Fe-S oxidoreductase